MADKKIIDLGWANGWHGTPPEVTQAREKGFKVENTYHNNRTCESHYKIETDDSIIVWKEDSSG